ncbi:MAG: hypothetical protein ACI92E_001615 [Oceanicoccus sp.]|jgi:hypothetical protein
MINIGSLSSKRRLFRCRVLNHTFMLLRKNHPFLALYVQNLLAETTHGSPAADIETFLPAARISEIVIAISAIAEQSTNKNEASSLEVIAIHSTMLEWLIYTQNFMSNMNLLFVQPKLHTN